MNIFEKLTRWLLYIMVIVTPVFFLPWSSFPLSLSKQTFLVVAVGIAFILWAINCIAKKELVYAKTPLNWIVLALVIFSGISAWFSEATSIGFWGTNGGEPDVFVNMLAFGVVYFLVSTTCHLGSFSRHPERSEGSLKDSSSASWRTQNDERAFGMVIFISAALVLVFSLMQIFGLWTLLWEFAQSRAFNPIGTSNALAIFLGAVFVMVVVFLTKTRKHENTKTQRIKNKKKNVFVFLDRRSSAFVLSVLSVVLFLTCFLLGFWPVFLGWVVVMGTLLFLSFRPERSEVEKSHHRQKGKSLRSLLPAMPCIARRAGDKLEMTSGGRRILLVVLGLSLLILFFYSGLVAIKMPVFNLSPEAMPNLEASWLVAGKTLDEGMKNLVFGSGPATFQYQYGLYKDIALNQTDFWNVNFSQGANAIMTHLNNWGALGVLLWLLFIGWLCYLSFRPERNVVEKSHYRQKGKTLRSLDTSQTRLRKLEMTVWSAPLLFLLLMLFLYPQNFTLYFMIFVLAGVMVGATAEKKNIKEPQRNFFISLVLTVAVVAVSGLVYLQLQRYTASVYFDYGVKHADMSYLSTATNFDQYSDLYLRTISGAYLISAGNTSDEEQFSQEINLAIQAAQEAVQLNKLSGVNWFNLALIYEALIPNVADSAQLAFDVYGEAINREPNSPVFYLGLGRAYLAADNQEMAIGNLQKALELKPDYQPAQELLDMLSTEVSSDEVL